MSNKAFDLKSNKFVGKNCKITVDNSILQKQVIQNILKFSKVLKDQTVIRKNWMTAVIICNFITKSDFMNS